MSKGRVEAKKKFQQLNRHMEHPIATTAKATKRFKVEDKKKADEENGRETSDRCGEQSE